MALSASKALVKDSVMCPLEASVQWPLEASGWWPLLRSLIGADDALPERAGFRWPIMKTLTVVPYLLIAFTMVESLKGQMRGVNELGTSNCNLWHSEPLMRSFSTDKKAGTGTIFTAATVAGTAPVCGALMLVYSK
jgi:hypothetical protein